jgi:DNA-binding MarR family transcriptional regulator
LVRLSLDNYVVSSLMPDLVGHDRSPAAFLVYLYFSANAAGRKRQVSVSLQTIADDTGLSKSAVQASLRILLRRKLVRAERSTATAVPIYEVLRPWARPGARTR